MISKNLLTLRVNIFFILVIPFLGGCQHSLPFQSAPMKLQANLPDEVYWAGLSFSGDYGGEKTAYPFTASILNESKDGRRIVDEIFLDVVKPITWIKTSELASISKGQKLAMSLVIDGEYTYSDYFGNTTLIGKKTKPFYKHSVYIYGKIMIFDFSERVIRGMIPILVESHAKLDAEPTDEDTRKLIRELIYDDSDNTLLDWFSNKITNFSLELLQQQVYIRVNSLNIKANALSYLDNPDPNQVVQIEQSLAQGLTAAVAKRNTITLIPFIKGHAIANRMSARFSNNQVYSFELPKGDYLFDIVLDFNVIPLKKKSWGEIVLYAVSLHIKAVEPISNEIFINDAFIATREVSIPHKIEINQKNRLINLARIISEDFAIHLSDPSSRWLKKVGIERKRRNQLKKSMRRLLSAGT